jgi:hypothetical protein
VTDLWSPEHFEQKAFQRVQDNKAVEFEPWEEAKQRFVAERLEPLLDLYRQSDHDWFKSWNRRKGDVMHSSDLIFRLQTLNPHIFVQQQINFPDDWGLYTSQFGRVQFLTGLPKSWLTEFSYALVDERNLPLEERRGWRTVLIYCLLKGAISWEQVLAEFGEPQDGFNDERWQNVTHDFRYGGEEIVGRNVANLFEV